MRTGVYVCLKYRLGGLKPKPANTINIRLCSKLYRFDVNRYWNCSVNKKDVVFSYTEKLGVVKHGYGLYYNTKTKDLEYTHHHYNKILYGWCTDPGYIKIYDQSIETFVCDKTWKVVVRPTPYEIITLDVGDKVKTVVRYQNLVSGKDVVINKGVTKVKLKTWMIVPTMLKLIRKYR